MKIQFHRLFTYAGVWMFEWNLCTAIKTQNKRRRKIAGAAKNTTNIGGSLTQLFAFASIQFKMITNLKLFWNVWRLTPVSICRTFCSKYLYLLPLYRQISPPTKRQETSIYNKILSSSRNIDLTLSSSHLSSPLSLQFACAKVKFSSSSPMGIFSCPENWFCRFRRQRHRKEHTKFAIYNCWPFFIISIFVCSCFFFTFSCAWRVLFPLTIQFNSFDVFSLCSVVLASNIFFYRVLANANAKLFALVRPNKFDPHRTFSIWTAQQNATETNELKAEQQNSEKRTSEDESISKLSWLFCWLAFKSVILLSFTLQQFKLNFHSFYSLTTNSTTDKHKKR